MANSLANKQSSFALASIQRVQLVKQRPNRGLGAKLLATAISGFRVQGSNPEQFLVGRQSTAVKLLVNRNNIYRNSVAIERVCRIDMLRCLQVRIVPNRIKFAEHCCIMAEWHISMAVAVITGLQMLPVASSCLDVANLLAI